MGILIQGGRIVDAATDTDKKGDIYLEDGVITEIGEKLKIKDKSDKVIDAKGCLVMPGLIDLHVHFRDPGQTQKEDIETGSRAAASLISRDKTLLIIFSDLSAAADLSAMFPLFFSPKSIEYISFEISLRAEVNMLLFSSDSLFSASEIFSSVCERLSSSASVPILSLIHI